MSEFIAAMDGGNSFYVGEHTVRRVVAGDVEAVRRRLAYALESLDYTVVSENPLQARRHKLKGAFAADFTEHTRRLAVALRPAGAAATSAVFDFAVVHAGCMTDGDKLTLEREADAIIAVAEAGGSSGVCRSCGTENGADARFCRLCGAPSASGEPAELEVLRLTAGARAGLQEIVGGLFIALLTVACMVPMIVFGSSPKSVRTGWIFLTVGEFVGWWMALYGVLRLYRTLNRPAQAQPLPAAATVPRFTPAQVSSLPPAHISVTEGTTELLGADPREREPVPARREQGDTSPIG